MQLNCYIHRNEVVLYIWVHLNKQTKIRLMYDRQVTEINPKEKLHNAVKGFMEFYSDLPANEQVDLFGMLKESVLMHRSSMINDCNSDAEAIKFRHEELVKGFESIKAL